MTVSQPNRSLRIMVARLAKHNDADVRAILDKLDPGQRPQILSLLAELDGTNDSNTAPSDEAIPSAVLIPESISPWLAARIVGDADSEAAAQDRFSITPHAQLALQRCAAAMVDVPALLPKPVSLLDRILARRI
jgi:hypothetical protein